MGLMSLISKKINPNKNQQRLRAPPYERNISSRSPVRIVRTVSAEDDGAPAPVIHIYRDEIQHKPATARSSSRQNGRFHELDFSKGNSHSGASLRSSTLSLFKLDRSGPITKTHASRNASISTSYRIGSISGFRGYVDVLDAQSELSPANSYGRIKASGIRDYGEDVADRNIGINGHNLDSRPVQEFYACLARPPSRITAPLRAFSTPRASLDEGDENTHPYCVVNEVSVDSTRWSQNVDPAHDYTLGRCQPISPAATSRGQSSKRNSLSALQSSSLTSSFNAFQHAEGRARRHSFRQGSTYDSGRGTELGNLQVPGLLSAWDSSSSEADEEDEPLPQIRVSNQPILSPQPTSFRLSAAMASPTFTSPSRHASRRSSIQSIKAPLSFDAHHSTMPDLSNLPHHLKERTRHFKESWPRDIMAEDREAAPSPSIKTSRPGSRSHDFDYPRNRGGLSTPPLSRQSLVHVPARSSSIRRGSISSTTPTISSSSSAVFPGPFSYHTADTSVDLSSIALSSILSSSLSSINIRNDGQPAKTGAEEAGNQEGGSSMMMLPAFNTGDVSDDDDDSFVGLQTNQPGGEEDLLFDDGYGVDGQQLPGLDDMFAAPAPVVKLRKPRLGVFSSCEGLQNAYNTAPIADRGYEQSISSDILSNAGSFQTQGPRSPGRRSPARSLKTRRVTASYSDFFGGLTNSSSSRKHRPQAIYYGLHHLASNVGDETIEEEYVEKLDVVSAVRLRKEAKSKQRASLVSMASESHVRDILKAIASDSMVAGSDTGEDEAELGDDENSADDAPSAANREDADIDEGCDSFPSLSSGVEEAQFYAN